MKRRLCNLQDSCFAKRRKVLEGATEVVGFAVELVGGADGVSSPGAQATVDSRIVDLDEQLATARAATVSLKTKVLALKEARDRVQQERDDISENMGKETKTMDDYIASEWGRAPSQYHHVLRSIRGVAKAADERSAGHTNSLTFILLLLKRGANLRRDRCRLIRLRREVELLN